MNKRFLLLLTLTFIIIVSSSLTYAFSDVEGHWAEETINKLYEFKIIKGYVDGTFKPDDFMTRAELVTMVDNMLGLETETDKYVPDILSKDWYYSNMKKALYFGIIQGDEAGNVNPTKNISREEAIAIIARAFKTRRDEMILEISFSDANEISDWAKVDFISFVRKHYINGYLDNTVRPKDNITRAEVLTILNRILNNLTNSSIYSQKINGNMLIKDKNIVLNNIELYGDLIIGESAVNTIQLTNVMVNGNLILYAPMDVEQTLIAVNGDIIKAYENKSISSLHYINEEYGIRFSVPDGASTYTGDIKNIKEIDKQDVIIVNIKKDDSNYFKSITEISKEEIKKLVYDSIFKKTEEGKIERYPYELYSDNSSSHFLIIKRDNIVYTLLFMNIVSNNILDNVISNITFTNGIEVNDHSTKIYKNSKLSLKFAYQEGYVGIDDSYNTNNVYIGNSIFKLFIQVNMITDMDEYSVEEIRALLKTLVLSDGNIINEDVMTINNHNAIQFEIESEEDKIISLYVIIGNNLYNFIFKGTSLAMDSIGKEMFTEIVNSMEF